MAIKGLLGPSAALVLLLTIVIHAEATCVLSDSCVTDLQQSDCPPDHYIMLNEGMDGCCPDCVYIPEPLRCDRDPCPPGKFCRLDLDIPVCEIDYASCFYTEHLAEKPVYMPRCNVDGTFHPVQCKGDEIVGRCFCTDARGKRIFGMAWTGESEDMTCACSRRRAELEFAGRNDVTLHCAPNGNYEPIQCESELCWCADEKTGNPTSVVIPEGLVDHLPCFNEEKFGKQYLRVCESKAHAVSNIKNTLRTHGTLQVTMETIVCDYDGTYGIYEIYRGIAYCTWKDGSRMGSWQTQAGANLGTMNCNCARDTVYFEQIGSVMTQTCSGNGNYMNLQQLNGQLYCVDNDGFPLTDLKPLGENLHCD